MQLPNYDEILKANTTAKTPLPDNETQIALKAIESITSLASDYDLSTEEAAEKIGAIVAEALRYGMPPREEGK